MSTSLENAIEKALLLAFTQYCEKYGASSMADMNDNILDQAKTTTNALLSMKDEMFKQNLKHRQLEAESMHNINSMTGMIPPAPIMPPKKSPRVTTNEDMLLSENEALKVQIEEKEEKVKAMDLRLGAAYESIKKFREDFEALTLGLNSRVVEAQSEVFTILGGRDIAP